MQLLWCIKKTNYTYVKVRYKSNVLIGLPSTSLQDLTFQNLSIWYEQFPITFGKIFKIKKTFKVSWMTSFEKFHSHKLLRITYFEKILQTYILSQRRQKLWNRLSVKIYSFIVTQVSTHLIFFMFLAFLNVQMKRCAAM